MKNLLYYAFIFLLVACDGEGRNVGQGQDMDDDNYSNAVREMHRFASLFCGVPACQNADTGRDEFTFIREARWDRTYIFNARRIEGIARATFNEVDLDYLDSKKNNQVITRGIAFELTDEQWERLMSWAKELEPKFALHNYSDGLLDGNIFILAYAGNTSMLNKGYVEDCERFSNFILDGVVDPEFARIGKNN
jgi:hypothetical protein